MHPLLEYLAIGVLLVVVILAAGQMIEAPSRTLETVRAEQLFTVAERLMDKVLLTPGYPENWGADLLLDEEVTDFGLALAGATAPYIIDPDKVMRLANLTLLPNPVPISAERIAELLGIKGEYGFRLEMKPMITASVTTLDSFGNIASVFRIRVVNWYGVGLPNARVTGIYVVARIKGGAKQSTVEELHKMVKTCITNALGICDLDYTDSIWELGRGSQHFLSPFLILHINWEGFVSITGYSPALADEPVKGYIIGNYIFLERFEDVTGAIIVKDEAVQVVPQYALLLDETEVVWCRAQPNDPEWCHWVAGRVLPSRRKHGVNYLVGRIIYLERLSSHVIVFGQWKGKAIAVVVSRMPEIDISYGPANVRPANMVTLTRVAQIYNYPYIIRLTLWRWVEGLP